MLNTTATYSIILLFYSLFFFLIHFTRKQNSNNLKAILTGKGSTGILLNSFEAGILLMGIGSVSIVLNRSFNENLLMPAVSSPAFPGWIMIAAAGLTGLFGSEKKLSPSSINIQPLSFSFPFLFILLRTLFLILYEIFFRGIMLFCMIEDFGMTIAVLVNLLLYVLIHWHSEKKERYGSVLMGLALCFISIYYQNVWPAIAIHLMMALSNEIGILITNRSLIKNLSV